MTTFNGTDAVNSGIYLNTKTFAVEMMDQAGTLAGTEFDTYRRIPMIVMLATAPLLGLLFVMFLPLVGFAMMFKLMGTKFAALVADASAEAVRVLQPSWAPALAFLTRNKPAKPAAPATTEPDAWKADVEKKLEENDRHTQ